MMAIMDMIMRKASNESASGTDTAVRKQVHRQYAIDLKRRIVEETFAPGASVSMVARRHDVNANLVFAWREKYRQGTLVDKRAAARAFLAAPELPARRHASAEVELIRVGVVDHDRGLSPLPVVVAEPPVAVVPSTALASGVIEIEWRSGIKVRVDVGIADAALRRIMGVIAGMT